MSSHLFNRRFIWLEIHFSTSDASITKRREKFEYFPVLGAFSFQKLLERRNAIVSVNSQDKQILSELQLKLAQIFISVKKVSTWSIRFLFP